MDFQYTQPIGSSEVSINNTALRPEPATPSTININNADTIQKPSERSVSQSCNSDLSSCINSLYDSESARSQSCDQNSSQTANNSEFVFVKPNPVQQNTNVNIVNNMQSDEMSVKVLQCDATNPNIHQTQKQIKVDYRVSWRGSDKPCNGSDIASGRIYREGKLCYGYNQSSCYDLDFYCTDYSEDDNWTSGRYTLFINPVKEKFNMTFVSGNWVGYAGWSLLTTVDLTPRNDTGLINSSPTVDYPPVVNLQKGCDHTITFPIQDVDDDIVKCRWANGTTECGSVCRSVINVLPRATLIQDNCSITYPHDANDTIGLYPLAIQVEDFNSSSSSVPLSSIPMQFMVNIFSIQNNSCHDQPVFVPPTPESGECFVVDVDETFSVNITVTGKTSLKSLVTTSAVGMQRSVVKSWLDDASLYKYHMSVNVTWIPSLKDDGQHHNLCFYARDIHGRFSETRCINVPIGGPNLTSVERIGITNAWNLKFDRTFSLPHSYVNLTVIETQTGVPVFTLYTGDTGYVTYFQSEKRIHVVLDFAFDPAEDYHVIIPEGCEGFRYGFNCLSVCSCNRTNSVACDNVDGLCDCFEGWAGENCTENINECVDINICSFKSNSTCVDKMGTYDCQCDDGYVSIDDECQDDNECEDDEYICADEANTQCVNTNGGYKCQCVEGFERNGNVGPCLIVCDDLEAPANGTILSSDLSTVIFKCYNGYLLVGEQKVECTNEGTWSYPPPLCLRKVGIGSHCNTSDICRPSGAMCIDSKCTCQTGIYNNNSDICDAMNLYPFGESYGDNVFENNNDDCGTPVQFRPGIPLFGDIHKTIYVCYNGFVSVGNPYHNPLPYRAISDFGTAVILAPFFADSIGGTMHYRTYDIQKNPDKLNSTEVKHVELFITRMTSNAFNSTFILFATWNKVRPVQDAFDHNSVSTFQLVLATDSSNTYALYIYGYGMMNWSFLSKAVFGPDIWIGYTSKQHYNFTNIFSFKADVIEMDKLAKYNDISGVLFNRLTHASPTPLSNEANCLIWYNQNKHLKTKVETISNEMPDCPCDIIGLRNDLWYLEKEDISSSTYICAEMLPSIYEHFGKSCCYEQGLLVVNRDRPYAGSLQLYTTEYPADHLVHDVKAFNSCCDSFSTCPLYYELHPTGKCSSKSSFDISALFGDPHFITLDGMNFTFNGFGEYSLLNISYTDNVTDNHVEFELQARTNQAFKENGSPSYATRFVAFAARDHTKASFQIELNNAEEGYTLFANGADLSLLYKDKGGQRTFKHTTQERNIVLAKHKKGLVVLFPYSEISLNITIGVKMLSLSVAVDDKYKHITTGLLGNYDGDPSNDFITPDGVTLAANLTEEDIFSYGQLWGTDPFNSVFNYPVGKTHSDYNFPDYRPKFLMNANPIVVTEAYRTCDGSENTQCVFDFVFTEDNDVALDTQFVERVVGNNRLTNNQTVPTISVCDMVYVKIGDDAVCEVNISDTSTVHVNVSRTNPNGNIIYDNSSGLGVRFTIDDASPEVISVSVSNEFNRRAQAIIPVAVCTGCSQHGKCIQTIRDDERQTENFKYQTCVCEPQYEGIDCEHDFDGCRAEPCSHKRNCTSLTADQQIQMNVSHICDPCPDGYDDFGDKCKDIDECINGNNSCEQTCLNNQGSYECSCTTGYRKSLSNDSLCLDINECDERLHNCGHICTNVDGGYNCSCWDRYAFNETTGECYLDNDVDICEQIGFNCSETSGCTVDIDGNATCFCETGLALSDNGTSCIACEFPFWGLDCQIECTCSLTSTVECDPVFGCICLPGWEGVSCDQDIDECETFPCSSTLQKCVNLPGDYRCDCIDGYEYNEEENICKDIDECFRSDLNKCTQTCTNVNGGYSCSCVDGYELYNDTLCQDIDDCEFGTNECEQLCSSGKFIAGSYNCYCYYGYLINDDRRTCRKDLKVRNLCEEIGLNCTHYCKPEVNPEISKCNCRQGYKLADDQQTCIDINECLDPAFNKCDQKAESFNTKGSYECNCPIGSVLKNRRKCQGCQCDNGWSGDDCSIDNDECATEPCLGFGIECRNTHGSFTCQCRSGYSQNETLQCSDIDECVEQSPPRCDQKCVNMQGSFRCECETGFKYTNDRCEDLDECSGISKCEHICTNTIGSYRCSCLNGFQLDTTNRQSCKPITTCSSNETLNCAQKNALCAVVNENSECICNVGYEKKTDNDVCIDIKECSRTPSPCQDHECVELQGGFRCQCYPGFYLLDDDVSCQECVQGTFGDNCNNTCTCETESTSLCDTTNGTCYCKDGWTGVNCEDDILECEGTDVLCGNNSVCADVPGSYICNCSTGYFKTGSGQCRVCDDFYFGEECSSECICDKENTESCDNVNGECTCFEGWSSENCTVDIDECKNNTTCSYKANSFCKNTNGSYLCQCNDGYQSQDNECLEIDECFDGTANCMQECINVPGDYTCQCFIGFKGSWNDCEVCNDNTFGFNCSETCSCNIMNSLDPNQTCIPTNGTCVCQDEWAGLQCNEDVDECASDMHDCMNINNTGCTNSDWGYSCECLTGFVRNSNTGPCEAEISEEVTLQDGWEVASYSISIKVSLSPDVDLTLAWSYKIVKQKVIKALWTFTEKYTSGRFQIIVIAIRHGSIEVDYLVSYDSKQSDIADQLAHAAVDLAAGNDIVYDGQNVSVRSTQFDNGTDLCVIYTSIINNCFPPNACVVKDGLPVCRLKVPDDKYSLVVSLSVALSLAVIIMIVIVFCCYTLRKQTVQKKLLKQELVTRRQITFPGIPENITRLIYDGRMWKAETRVSCRATHNNQSSNDHVAQKPFKQFDHMITEPNPHNLRQDVSNFNKILRPQLPPNDLRRANRESQHPELEDRIFYVGTQHREPDHNDHRRVHRQPEHDDQLHVHRQPEHDAHRRVHTELEHVGHRYVHRQLEHDDHLHVHGEPERDDHLRVHREPEHDDHLRVHRQLEHDDLFRVHRDPEHVGHLRVHGQTEHDDIRRVQREPEYDNRLVQREHGYDDRIRVRRQPENDNRPFNRETGHDNRSRVRASLQHDIQDYIRRKSHSADRRYFHEESHNYEPTRDDHHRLHKESKHEDQHRIPRESHNISPTRRAISYYEDAIDYMSTDDEFAPRRQIQSERHSYHAEGWFGHI
ncbi:hypothetical protein ACF0H5_004803 [Mactra antiquata]